MNIQIEKNIPMPAAVRQGGSGRPTKYPYKDMEVGDSFFVPDATTKKFSARLSAWKKSTGHFFALRSVDNGVRVWRKA